MAVRWARPAQIDLAHARAWARESSPGAARDLVARIRKGVARLRSHPRIGQRLEDIPLRVNTARYWSHLTAWSTESRLTATS